MTANSLSGKKGSRILFVCTANICRSPMAQALFQARLQKECPNNWKDWQIESAGTWAQEGRSASKNSQRIMTQRGLNITNHSARIVTAEMLSSFNLILTMEPGHKEALQVEFPTIASRVFMISEMIGKEEPVSDPYGGPIEKYEETAQRLENIFEKGFEKIISLSQNG